MPKYIVKSFLNDVKDNIYAKFERNQANEMPYDTQDINDLLEDVPAIKPLGTMQELENDVKEVNDIINNKEYPKEYEQTLNSVFDGYAKSLTMKYKMTDVNSDMYMEQNEVIDETYKENIKLSTDIDYQFKKSQKEQFAKTIKPFTINNTKSNDNEVEF
ncbi:hypothetical protein [Enterococcus faecalis]|uniref:hypothetical protein n=1 Tax=Enterococcus faecalis TaxID=1351 RepID=UPI0039A602DF